jgi:hypothetical protein
MTDTPSTAPPGIHGTPKSMGVFFLDNQGSWPEGVEQAGDLVVWPDTGQYPTFVPVAAASHPNFDGKVVVLAGNRGLIVAMVAGAESMDDVRRALQSRQGVTQFRVAVDAIVHRLVLHCCDRDEHTHVHPASLFTWLTTQHRAEASVVQRALTLLLKNSDELRQLDEEAQGAWNSFETAEKILEYMALAPFLRAREEPLPAPDGGRR